MAQAQKRERFLGLTLFLVILSFAVFQTPATLFFTFVNNISSAASSRPASSLTSVPNRKLGLAWGTVVPATISGNFPKLDCELNGKKICCSAIENEAKKSRKPQIPMSHRQKCILSKEYFPSAYETRHLQVAEELAKIEDLATRTVKFIEFVESPEEIEHAKRWLDRIALRQTGLPLTENDVDLEYISRFRVTRRCIHSGNQSWWEYIEPLSVHARHPFALGHCWHPHFRGRTRIYKGAVPKTSLLSLDYLLLQNPNDLTGQHLNKSKTGTDHHSSRITSSFEHEVFLFDAGTSRFDSSLFWFICAYEQLGFIFDHIFGWEFTLLEPTAFWDHVPVRYIGLYHFFNAPISSDPSSRHSPTRLIKQMTSPKDFVSFKLDVDTVDVEIPIALEILNDPEIHPLIDEFFFELHFRCEVLLHCGWGMVKMPEELGGLKLDRPSALKFFRDLRIKGIRAHFWP